MDVFSNQARTLGSDRSAWTQCLDRLADLKHQLDVGHNANFLAAYAIMNMKYAITVYTNRSASEATKMVQDVLDACYTDACYIKGVMSISARTFPNYIISAGQFVLALNRQYLMFMDDVASNSREAVLILQRFSAVCINHKNASDAVQFEQDVHNIFAVSYKELPESASRPGRPKRKSDASALEEAADEQSTEDAPEAASSAAAPSGRRQRKKIVKARDPSAASASADDSAPVEPPVDEAQQAIDLLLNDTPKWATSSVQVVRYSGLLPLTEPLCDVAPISCDDDQGLAYEYSAHHDDVADLDRGVVRDADVSNALKMPIWSASSVDTYKIATSPPSEPTSLEHSNLTKLANVDPDWAARHIDILMSPAAAAASGAGHPYLTMPQHASFHPEDIDASVDVDAEHVKYWSVSQPTTPAPVDEIDGDGDSSMINAPSSSPSASEARTYKRGRHLATQQWPNTRDHRAPKLCFEAWPSSAHSLLAYMQDNVECDDVRRSKFEYDVGTTVTCSRLYCSPLFATQYHHQLSGTTMWLLIHANERARLIAMFADMMTTQFCAVGSTENAPCPVAIANLYLSSKVFTTSPAELTTAKIPFTQVRLDEGKILVVPGDMLRIHVNVPGAPSLARTFYHMPTNLLRECRLLRAFDAHYANVQAIFAGDQIPGIYGDDASLATMIDRAAPFDMMCALTKTVDKNMLEDANGFDRLGVNHRFTTTDRNDAASIVTSIKNHMRNLQSELIKIGCVACRGVELDEKVSSHTDIWR